MTEEQEPKKCTICSREVDLKDCFVSMWRGQFYHIDRIGAVNPDKDWMKECYYCNESCMYKAADILKLI